VPACSPSPPPPPRGRGRAPRQRRPQPQARRPRQQAQRPQPRCSSSRGTAHRRGGARQQRLVAQGHSRGTQQRRQRRGAAPLVALPWRHPCCMSNGLPACSPSCCTARVPCSTLLQPAHAFPLPCRVSSTPARLLLLQTRCQLLAESASRQAAADANPCSNRSNSSSGMAAVLTPCQPRPSCGRRRRDASRSRGCGSS
jgi:hypothetical protein